MDSNKVNYHHGNLKPALIQAGLDILRNDGVQAISLRAVARKANVSQAAPYHHFQSKTILLSEITAIGFVELAQILMVCISQYKNNKELFLKISMGYLSYAKDNKSLFQLMMGNGLATLDRTEDLTNKQQHAFSIFAEAAENCLKTYDLPHNVNDFTLTWSTVLQGIAVTVINDRTDGFMRVLGAEKSNDEEDLKMIADRLTCILIHKI